MRRTGQLKAAALLTVLALAPAGPVEWWHRTVRTCSSTSRCRPKAAPSTGTVWQSDKAPLPDARLQLRDTTTGQIVRSTRADEWGRFTFPHVSGGSYVVELVDENRHVVALGEMFTMGPTETVSTVVRLAASNKWYGGSSGMRRRRQSPRQPRRPDGARQRGAAGQRAVLRGR